MVESAWEKAYKRTARTPEEWWMIPGSGNAFAGRFQGTFEEAVVDAASRSAYWKTTYYIHEDRTREGVPPKDRVGELWGKVSIPKESPLRNLMV